ncbi:MAG TPA: hypothetical protein VMD30_08465 [Tepidisphaeraceae bacterium]|nr:hypothetical protein [Tepidisphaeraceae bacterium]
MSARRRKRSPNGRSLRAGGRARACSVAVADGRVRRIEEELHRLSLDNHPNAVSLLSRVFVELSVDAYIAAQHIAVTRDANLRDKIQHVLVDLVNRGKLSPSQVHPLRTALQKDSFLAPSKELMNEYVHAHAGFSAPGQLRADWNAMRPFFAAIAS